MKDKNGLKARSSLEETSIVSSKMDTKTLIGLKEFPAVTLRMNGLRLSSSWRFTLPVRGGILLFFFIIWDFCFILQVWRPSTYHSFCWRDWQRFQLGYKLMQLHKDIAYIIRLLSKYWLRKNLGKETSHGNIFCFTGRANLHLHQIFQLNYLQLHSNILNLPSRKGNFRSQLLHQLVRGIREKLKRRISTKMLKAERKRLLQPRLKRSWRKDKVHKPTIPNQWIWCLVFLLFPRFIREHEEESL